MKARLVLLTLVTLLTLSHAATASQTAVPTRPEMRMGIQQQYILTALWEGRLTWAAAKKLLVEQDVVALRAERFRSDGDLSRREVRVLDYMLDIASRNIDLHLRPAAPAPNVAEAVPGATVAGL